MTFTRAFRCVPCAIGLADNEQFTLALNVCEVMLCLHWTYYVRALHHDVPDPTLSIYGQSYLTVVERCNVSQPAPSIADC